MSELEEFLAAYASSYETFDPVQVAGFINCPCIFFLRDECELLDTESGIQDFMRTGLAAYRDKGCARFKARLLQERTFGPRFALIDVEWEPEDASGGRVMHFTTTYNLVQVAGQWRISVITRHDQ